MQCHPAIAVGGAGAGERMYGYQGNEGMRVRLLDPRTAGTLDALKPAGSVVRVLGLFRGQKRRHQARGMNNWLQEQQAPYGLKPGEC